MERAYTSQGTECGMEVSVRPPDNVDELDYPRHEWVAAEAAPRAGSRDHYVSTLRLREPHHRRR